MGSVTIFILLVLGDETLIEMAVTDSLDFYMNDLGMGIGRSVHEEARISAVLWV